MLQVVYSTVPDSVHSITATALYHYAASVIIYIDSDLSKTHASILRLVTSTQRDRLEAFNVDNQSALHASSFDVVLTCLDYESDNFADASGRLVDRLITAQRSRGV